MALLRMADRGLWTADGTVLGPVASKEICGLQIDTDSSGAASPWIPESPNARSGRPFADTR